MARKKPKLTEHQKAIKRFVSRVKTAQKAGFVFEDEWIEKQKRRSTAKLNELRGINLRSQALGFAHPDTGELVSAREGRKITREIQQHKANLTKASKAARIAQGSAKQQEKNLTRQVKPNYPQRVKERQLEPPDTDVIDDDYEEYIPPRQYYEDDEYDDYAPPSQYDEFDSDGPGTMYLDQYYDTILDNVTDIFDQWTPNITWSPEFTEIKRSDMNIAKSIIRGAVSQMGSHNVAINIEFASESVHDLVWEIVYGESGDRKDRGTVESLNKLSSILFGRPLTDVEAKFYSEDAMEYE